MGDEQHFEPVITVLNYGDLSQSSQSQKRNNESPPIQEQNKRYVLDTASLISKNRYYLPPQNEISLSDNPEKVTLDKPTPAIKVPPIFIYEVSNYKQLVEDIKSKIKGEFILTNKGTQIKVNLNSIEDYRSLTSYFDENNDVKFHTYRNPEETTISVIIRNIPISITNDEIQQELMVKKYPVVSVTRLQNKEKKPIPICAVVLNKSAQSNAIYELDYLYYCKITVEPRRTGKGLVQCTRCQRYSHTKNYCRLNPRCVKCLGDHHFSKCPKPKNDKPRCVNCNGEHTANYRGCEYYKKLTKNRNQQQLNRNTSPKVSVTNGRSYANVSQNRNYNINKPYSTTHENTTETEQDSLIHQIVSTIVQIISPYMNKIKEFILSIIPSLLQNVNK